MSLSDDSQQRLIVLTGCTRGLGRAMLDEFVEYGHVVAGCGRSERDLESLREAHGEPHRFDVVDVSDDAAVAAWAEAILDDLGVPDLLVNNAGVINGNASLWDVPADEFARVLSVNVSGVANTIRHFVPAMIENGAGVIVNFSSGWGRSTSPEVGPYCASKWAIEGLTRSLAQELPRGLAAVPLNPGVIDTDLLRSCFGRSAAGYPAAEDWAARAVPLILSFGPQHSGQPETVPL